MKDINDSAVGSYKLASNIKPTEFSDTQIINWAETILEKRFIRSHYLTSPEMIPCPKTRSRDRAILLVGLGAGLRCSEICALDVSDIDFNSGVLSVREGKGRKSRQIYLAKEILQALNEWRTYKTGNEAALFCKIIKNGRIINNRLSPSGLDYMLAHLQQLSIVEKFTPHDLRRTFITQLLEEGVDLHTVKLASSFLVILE